jgi:hypothetical protein
MRLQQMFGPNVKTAVQDPSYPVYVDTSVMLGQTGEINTDTMQYSNIVYMPCTPENGFFPDYANHERADVVYICSPKYVPDVLNGVMFCGSTGSNDRFFFSLSLSIAILLVPSQHENN